nr:hypothetical protein CFP56_11408 [Quercus suber]
MQHNSGQDAPFPPSRTSDINARFTFCGQGSESLQNALCNGVRVKCHWRRHVMSCRGPDKTEGTGRESQTNRVAKVRSISKVFPLRREDDAVVARANDAACSMQVPRAAVNTQKTGSSSKHRNPRRLLRLC